MAERWYAPGVIEPALFQNGAVEISPDEIFDFMSPPSDFILFGAEISYHRDLLKLTVRADNLLNTSYRSYTDRLRYFSDANGRNLSIALGVQF